MISEIGDLLLASNDRQLVYLRDIATITRAYEEVPGKMYFVDGRPGLTLGISMLGGENVVAVGERLLARNRSAASWSASDRRWPSSSSYCSCLWVCGSAWSSAPSF